MLMLVAFSVFFFFFFSVGGLACYCGLLRRVFDKQESRQPALRKRASSLGGRSFELFFGMCLLSICGEFPRVSLLSFFIANMFAREAKAPRKHLAAEMLGVETLRSI